MKTNRFFIVLFRAQTIMKGRLKGAQTGHNLLKKKADALSIRFRSILKKIIEVKRQNIEKIDFYSFVGFFL